MATSHKQTLSLNEKDSAIDHQASVPKKQTQPDEEVLSTKEKTSAPVSGNFCAQLWAN